MLSSRALQSLRTSGRSGKILHGLQHMGCKHLRIIIFTVHFRNFLHLFVFSDSSPKIWNLSKKSLSCNLCKKSRYVGNSLHFLMQKLQFCNKSQKLWDWWKVTICHKIILIYFHITIYLSVPVKLINYCSFVVVSLNVLHITYPPRSTAEWLTNMFMHFG